MRRVIAVITVGMALLPGTALATDSSVPFIRANQVHAQGITGRGATVAVIDTGIYFGHPGLGGSIRAGGISFEGGQPIHDGGADIYGYGHGTYMSLIITDESGVAPDADILSIRVFGPWGYAREEDIILGINYASQRRQQTDRSVRVINLSLGGGSCACRCDNEEPELALALANAAAAGIVTFAATGNAACCESICAPACAFPAMPVAAAYDGYYGITYFAGRTCVGECGDWSQPYYVTCFSNWVEECTALSAPGYDITVHEFTGDGTSQATAHSSGVAALMFAKNACGSLNAYDVRQTIYDTARDIWFAYPYCPLPPPPRHLDALPAVNAVPAAPCIRGDLNRDGAVNSFDIDPFVLALTNPAGYQQAYPNCDRLNADINCDGLLNFFDIDPFVGCLAAGQCPPCP